ncbi:MAG: LamB/YcsF family protein [Actinobacteria bacterium]|nr:LamB/YcsF family protein [Actinomycetota bacterium]
MARVVDLNCDMGESFGIYRLGSDEEIIKYITSANVACMFHGGDPCQMRKTVQMAKRYGVGVGAHPGWPDLLGFGRRWITKVSCAEVRDYIVYQVGALKAFCQAEGLKLQHVKPHGAMYNQAMRDEELCEAIVLGIRDLDPDLIFVGHANSIMIEIGRKHGLRVCNEIFADRPYGPDGKIVSGHVLHDPSAVAKQVVQILKEGKVTAVDGSVVDLTGESICVHGDTPEAPEHVNMLVRVLGEAGIAVRRMGSFL